MAWHGYAGLNLNHKYLPLAVVVFAGAKARVAKPDLPGLMCVLLWRFARDVVQATVFVGWWLLQTQAAAVTCRTASLPYSVAQLSWVGFSTCQRLTKQFRGMAS